MSEITKIPTSLSLVVAQPMNLPADISFPVSGNEIIGDLTDDEIERARAVAASTDPLDPATAQTFGSSVQHKLTHHLDSLLSLTVTRDAGPAGDILAEVASGVDMVQLDKLKSELTKGTGIIARFFSAFSAFKALRARNKEILDHFDAIEKRAHDLKFKLLDDDAAGNVTVGLLEEALDDFELHLVAGEAAWAKALSDLGPAPVGDAREAAVWNDKNETLKMFQTRLAKLAVAYVDSIKAIAEIRAAQQAGRIEVQNITDVIYLTIPRVKRAIVQLVSVKNIQDAQRDSAANQKLANDLMKITADATSESYLEAKRSQGNVLEDVQVLEECFAKFSEMIKEGKSIDAENAKKLREAHTGLVKVKNGLSEVLSQAA